MNLYEGEGSSIGQRKKLGIDVVQLKCSLSLSPGQNWDMKGTTELIHFEKKEPRFYIN